ncbi:hypothetical protein [uncultured Kordia sp.]|uniref:hypothetical protein n=1 Tax=uncultured Kordia sp. TaxID=507699 RepID=UPI002618EAE5|nr:hypothetical protein [uncultured Kordia sp.]
MKEQDFNPAIAAVVSIRHLVKGIQQNWSDMMDIKQELTTILSLHETLVLKYGTEHTQKTWKETMQIYRENIADLQVIMSDVKAQLQAKKSDNISTRWNKYPMYAAAIAESFKTLAALGKQCIPENELARWNSNWEIVYKNHQEIQQDAEACTIQLQMIETYTPTELDELTETILTHIPIHYSEAEAKQYTTEYMDAYEAIKQEASQKKNLWDRFLDILAGGVQQTPAQRVMMQRWVNGEKGEAH